MTNSKTPPEDPFKTTQYYMTPSGLPDEVLDALCKQCQGFEDSLMPSTVSAGTPGKYHLNKEIRVSKNCWISYDHWIAAVMAHLVRDANDSFFKFDLTRWSEKIQYAVYEGKGSNYNWHTDTALSQYHKNTMRKLSISLFLSGPEEYEGGEFQMLVVKDMHSIKPPKGTAIIFPSTITHRVRPLKSGIRRSLVGWYGGPPWR
jgi:PKHD-type hydroxylase